MFFPSNPFWSNSSFYKSTAKFALDLALVFKIINFSVVNGPTRSNMSFCSLSAGEDMVIIIVASSVLLSHRRSIQFLSKIKYRRRLTYRRLIIDFVMNITFRSLHGIADNLNTPGKHQKDLVLYACRKKILPFIHLGQERHRESYCKCLA